MLEHSVSLAGLVLTLAAIVAIITRRLKFPYTAGLVIAGAIFALIPNAPHLPLSRDLIFALFLPPLIFETAFQLKWKPLARDLAFTGTLASLGVVIATFVVGAGMHYFLGWDWLPALLFGALISATDPVSVIAMFKEIIVPARLDLAVETESLLNDGTASVMFAIVLVYVAGGQAGPVLIAWDLVWTVGGGLVLGLGIAVFAMLLMWRTNDPLVEVVVTLIVAYSAFITADHFGMSGPISTLAAGLLLGNSPSEKILPAQHRARIILFWSLAAFVANSFIFILIGENEMGIPFTSLLGAIAVAYLLTVLGRAAAVYSIGLVFYPTRWRMPIGYQHVLVWGGLRGAMALALSLSLPHSLPERTTIITVTFAVVALSIFLQGLTMPSLARALGLIRGTASERPRPDHPVA